MNKNLILLIIQLIILVIEIIFIVKNFILIREIKLLTSDECKYVIDYSYAKDIYGTTAYRIIALKDLGYNIKKGDTGGWVSSYKNLSQKDNCWIYDDSAVIDNARVMDDSIVMNKSICCDKAIIKNNSFIRNSFCCDRSVLCNSNICNCIITGNTKLISIKSENQIYSRYKEIDMDNFDKL